MQEIWTIQKVLNWSQEYFHKHQVPDPRLSAELLLAGVLKLQRLELYIQFERILSADELAQYRRYVQRRVKFEPVQYILGQQDFMGLTFTVNPAVLIPRPETELLVEAVLAEITQRNNPSLTIMDIGTGSGAIAVSLAHHLPRARVIALDNSEAALKVAQQNAHRLAAANVTFLLADFFTDPLSKLGKTDIIVSNPPYVSQEQFENLHPQVKNFEPSQALLAGSDGLDFLRKLIQRAPEILIDGGLIFFEIGFDQRNQVENLLLNNQFKNISFIKDLQNIYRIVKAQL